jgi:hypothetical protein
MVTIQQKMGVQSSQEGQNPTRLKTQAITDYFPKISTQVNGNTPQQTQQDDTSTQTYSISKTQSTSMHLMQI